MLRLLLVELLLPALLLEELLPALAKLLLLEEELLFLELFALPFARLCPAVRRPLSNSLIIYIHPFMYSDACVSRHVRLDINRIIV